jgi:hypothetical protein
VVESIGDHIVVECTDFQSDAVANVDKMKEILAQAQERVEAWRGRGDIVVENWSQERYLNVANFAPFSIFPLPDIARVKLSTGALWLVGHVNLSAVLRYMEARGWTIMRGPDQAKDDEGVQGEMHLGTVRKGPLTVELPGPWIGRLGYEFLKPRTIVAALEALLEAGPPAGSMMVVNLAGEAEVWD